MSDQTSTIPKSWKMTTLGDKSIQIGDGNYSSKYPQADELLESGIPFISNKDLSGGRIDSSDLRYLSDKKHAELKKGHLKTNDVLVSTRANIGDIALVTREFDDANINAQLVFLRADEKLIHSKFLYFLLSSNAYRSILGSYSSGSAQSQLPIGALKQVPLIFPPLLEQRAIAAVLSSLDDKIELLREQNKTLEATAQAIFKEWFVDFNFPGSIGKMIDSELGQIPEGWKIGKLRDILSNIESGSRPKGGIDSTLKLGIPSVGAESIDGIGNYNFSGIKYVTKDFFKLMKRGLVKDYDVLIYKDGAYVGKKAMFGLGFPFDVFAVNEHVFILRTNKISNQFFLYFLLKQEELSQLNTNSAQPGLNQEAMKNLTILIPLAELVDKFGRVVNILIDKILINSKQIQTLSAFRDTLLPKLMKGEVRVKEFKD